MSKIVGPIPPYLGDIAVPEAARWWRYVLTSHGGEHVMFWRTDAAGPDLSTATWVSCEWRDGHDTIIDVGMDRPRVRTRISRDDASQDYTSRFRIDVLTDERPTPADGWEPLSAVGDHRHPDDPLDERIVPGSPDVIGVAG